MSHYFCGCVASVSEPLTRRWSKTDLLWAWRGQLPGLTEADCRMTVAKAFAAWQAACGLVFAEATNGQDADILLTTGRIDGSGQILAWSEFPAGLRRVTQKYDTGDRFVTELAPAWPQVGLLEVCAHEIGHALGLDHDAEGTGSLLEPTYEPGRWQPQPRDVARAVQLYGEPAPRPRKRPAPPGERQPAYMVLLDDQLGVLRKYRLAEEPLALEGA